MSDYGNNNRFSGNYGSGNRGGYSQNSSGGGGGSYGERSSGGGYGGNNRGGFQGGNRGGWQGNRGGFQKQQAPVDPDPYVPVVMYSNDNPPLEVIEKFKKLAEKLAALKFTIRVAGGNTDACKAALSAAGEKLEEYLPWKNFNERESKFQFSDDSSIEQACKFHPAPDKLKDAAKKFLSRNYRMAQGQRLNSPAKIFIVWSDDGASRLSEKTFNTGSVGHFLSIASGTKGTVFNLGKEGTFEKLMEFLEPEKEPENKRPQNQGQERPSYPRREDGGNNGYRQERNDRYGQSDNRQGREEDIGSDFNDEDY